jgi:flagellar hook-associated protein 1 FlgK
VSTITGIMSNALRGLNTYTTAINVANSNITNADSEGYTRQEAVIQATGTGTSDVSSIRRVYDSFLAAQITDAKQELGKWTAEQECLSGIEEIFTSDDSTGLDAVMTEFWNSWEDLVSDPSSSTVRSTLAAAALSLTDTLNQMSESLSSMQESIDDEIAATADTANRYLGEIADLNKRLATAGSSDETVNTLKDEIDSLVSSLSSLIDISTYTNSQGQVCVQTTDGHTLVEGGTAWTLSTAANSSTGLLDVTLSNGGGTSEVITDDISGGELAGYIEVRDELIPGYQSSLDDLASAIITAVNTLHEAGYDLNGDAGVAFFTGAGAGDIAVNSAILNDPSKIAASSDGSTGDSTQAEAIANLQDSSLLNGGKSTCSEYYESLVTGIGEKVNSVESSCNAQTEAVELYESRRESVSGVSLDEEETKLVLYQNAYTASAKMISMLDEMLQEIIDMVD